ncbi:hypothetical protein GF322_04375 [Candidatus Dependentiae bacterium]|nr:hypothetical protein [Candidatus Dependentiae bacterium]
MKSLNKLILSSLLGSSFIVLSASGMHFFKKLKDKRTRQFVSLNSTLRLNDSCEKKIKTSENETRSFLTTTTTTAMDCKEHVESKFQRFGDNIYLLMDFLNIATQKKPQEPCENYAGTILSLNDFRKLMILTKSLESGMKKIYQINGEINSKCFLCDYSIEDVVESGDVELLKKIIVERKISKLSFSEALIKASEKGKFKMLQELLNLQNDIKGLTIDNNCLYNALIKAIRNNHEKVVKILLNRNRQTFASLVESNPLISKNLLNASANNLEIQRIFQF